MKDIVGYEGLYAVTQDGRVWSWVKMKYLHLIEDNQGYHVVNLYKNGNKRMGKVHRLVALAFIENNEGKTQINHKNGIKTDNRVENLEWCTFEENIKHVWTSDSMKEQRNKILSKGMKNILVNNKLSESQVNEIRKLHSLKKYTYSQLGNLFGISESSAWDVVNYKTYKNIGFS